MCCYRVRVSSSFLRLAKCCCCCCLLALGVKTTRKSKWISIHYSLYSKRWMSAIKMRVCTRAVLCCVPRVKIRENLLEFCLEIQWRKRKKEGRKNIDCTRKCKWSRSEICVHKSSHLRSAKHFFSVPFLFLFPHHFASSSC